MGGSIAGTPEKGRVTITKTSTSSHMTLVLQRPQQTTLTHHLFSLMPLPPQPPPFRPVKYCAPNEPTHLPLTRVSDMSCAGNYLQRVGASASCPSVLPRWPAGHRHWSGGSGTGSGTCKEGEGRSDRTGGRKRVFKRLGEWMQVQMTTSHFTVMDAGADDRLTLHSHGCRCR